MNMIREMFPNTEIIIDRFHIVQNINREFENDKIRMYSFDKIKMYK